MAATVATMQAQPGPTTATATASGLLAMLSEPSPQLVSAALSRLLAVVDTLWHEVSESLPELEALAEDAELESLTRQTAAAVASRVFFHLEEPAQALRLALEAGERHFDIVNDKSAYVETLIAAAVEAYIEQKGQATAAGDGGADADSPSALDMDKLERVVDLMFQRCYVDGTFEHALGVAFEAREAVKASEVLKRAAQEGPEVRRRTLDYALDAAVTLVASKAFRVETLMIVADELSQEFHETRGTEGRKTAAVALCQAHQILGQAAPVSQLITSLLEATEEEALLGLQLCFDLIDSGDQGFINAVAEGLALPKPTPADQAVTVTVDGDGDGLEVVPSVLPERSESIVQRFQNVQRILTDGFSSELALSFLHKNSDSDKLIMENLKKALEDRASGSGRNSILHNCAVATHAYLNAGTTNDSFLRDHLDWMRKASNWAKFSATASLGVLHAGHTTEAMTLLQPYLPTNPSGDEGAAGVTAEGGYAEGGSLFALGLIHGSHVGSSSSKRLETCEFLRNHLRVSHANEVISHGAALGVGLTAFGSNNLEIVNELKELLFTDSAAAGEAAGMSIGMVLVGSGAGNAQSSLGADASEELLEIVSELKNYARETHHEKIIRGIAMGIALINFGQEENADAVIEEMRGDRDPILRYGAQYSIALAYCGTGSNKAIRSLLHTAVSDVSDDVRMAAVIGLAFVLFKTPERVPQLVKLLLESFNPHVRYASCMAVGIAMAGSGDPDSVALLEPMLEDMVDYVRQGALIGTAMVYMQQSDACNGRKIKTFREKLTSIIGDKHQSTLTKMGAILATGMIDAGGRNCSLSLGSKNGFTKMSTAVGLALWLQHWHWFPMMHMLSLALTPTYTIGLNSDFKYPKNFEIQCNSKPSVFGYPKRLEEKKEEKKKRVETVTLSTTAKSKARIARKRAKEDAETGVSSSPMDVDSKEGEAAETKAEESPATSDDNKEEGEAMDIDNAGESAAAETKPKKKREPEPTSFRISNPSRVTVMQSTLCGFDLDQRYRPIRPDQKPYGVIMLTDSTPGEEEDLGAVKPPSLEVEDEADAPEPFEWTPPSRPETSDGAASASAAESADADESEETSV